MTASAAAFDRLADRIVDRSLRLNPIEATALGVHEHDHLLPDLSADGVAAAVSEARDGLAALRGLDEGDLDAGRRVDRALLIASLTGALRELDELQRWRVHPGLYADAALYGCYLVIIREGVPLPRRLANLAARLEGWPELLAQARANLTRPPREFTRAAIESGEGGLAFFRQLMPAVAAGASQIGAGEEALRRRLEEGAARAARALEQYLDFLRQDVAPRSDGSFATGRAVFERMLREEHFLDYTAASMQEAGRRLIAETEAQIRDAARAIDPARGWQDIVADLKRDHPTADGLLDEYRAELARVRAFVLERGVVDIPPGETLLIEETPAFQRAMIPYAAYVPPAPFAADQTGRFWVTPVDPRLPQEQQEQQLQGHCRWSMPITTLHEGYPGHHLQFVWAAGAATRVRKIAASNLFAEGWAFYCEQLMEDLGYIADPRQRLFRLKDQLWRAARIVVDVGLHAFGMGFQEAVDFMISTAHLEPVNARVEVQRYVQSPTQPMSYLIGKLELLKLAAEYRRRRGEAPLKDFHADLLRHGTLPPALLAHLLFN